MPVNVYNANALTGGTNTSLDGIDGSTLNNGDYCVTFTDTYIYVHYLNATSGAAESSPDVIAPDTNPGTKRWILKDFYLLNNSQLTTISGDIISYVDTAIATATGSLTVNHSELNELDYASAGHTGFLSSAQFTTSSGDIIDYVDSEITAATGSLTQDHGDLDGLDDDDHTQYVLVDGSRNITGTLTVEGGAVYAGVNTLLIIINLITSTQYLWFKWPLVGWGIGLFFHALGVFAFSKGLSIKERMIEKEMKKETLKKH